ncbi:MAG: hypothetical protein DCC55_14680 [Chloroflexi bacterium]|nr:MAG: hypothetical protein DCC55_14680 [Chloroflexota bacterium]
MAESPGEEPTDIQAEQPGDEARPRTQTELIAIVADKEARKLQARRERNKGIWFGLGMFGMIGWSVAVPTLVCVALGLWLDRRWPGPISWTLTLLFVGIFLGCLNAWYWVSREGGLAQPRQGRRTAPAREAQQQGEEQPYD